MRGQLKKHRDQKIKNEICSDLQILKRIERSIGLNKWVYQFWQKSDKYTEVIAFLVAAVKVRKFNLKRIGEGNGNQLQYSCLENPMDIGAWEATVHRVARVEHNLELNYYCCYYIIIKVTKICLRIYLTKCL